MKNLLATLSDREALTLAMEAFPEKIQEILDHGDPHAWLQSQEAVDRILAKIPLRLLEQAIGQVTQPEAGNPLKLDSQVKSRLQRALADLPRTLVSRARSYLDRLDGLVWEEGIKAWTAEVWGTGLYQVAFYSDGRRECTCPYAYGNGECKHQAALIMGLLRECGTLGIKDLPPPAKVAMLPAKSAVMSVSAQKAHTAGLTFLHNIDKQFVPAALDAENPRQRVEYHLEVRKRSARLCYYDLIPHSSSLRQGMRWEREARDLRHGFDRFRTPPKYLSQHDVSTIQLSYDRMISGGYGSTPLRCSHALLEMAASTERTVLGNGSIVKMDPEYWKLVPSLSVDAKQGSFHFALLPLWGETADLELDGDWYLLGEDGNWLVLADDTLYRLDPRTPQALVALADELRPIPVSALEEARPVLHRLSKNGVDVPVGWLPPQLHEKPKGCVLVSLIADCAKVQPRFIYPSLEVDVSLPDDVLAFTRNDGNLVELVRDREAEKTLLVELAALLRDAEVEFVPDVNSVVVMGDHDLRRLAFAGLPSIEGAGWIVRDAKALDRWKTRKGKALLRGKSSGQDWFELSGVVDFEGLQIPLSSLVASKGRVNLPDGSRGEVSRALLKRLEWIEKLGTHTADGILLNGFQAALAQDLLDGGHAEAISASEWKEQLEQALHLDADETPLPTSLQAQLRPYQHEGFQWLSSLRRRRIGGILADDMGLGKTVQLISHLCAIFEADPSAPAALVVGPASVVGNWIAEIGRFAPHLQTRLLHGNFRDGARELPVRGPTVFVTTYGILPREKEWLQAREFSVVVLDESQTIRNPLTVTHQCCLELQARQKVCLTGTPIENSLADLWAQFAFLNPGLLGPKEDFLAQFEPEDGQAPDLSRLRMLTAPFWLRRTKSQVALELPPREDILLPVELDPKQMALYQRQLKEYQKSLLPRIRKAGLDQGGRFEVLTALLRLRQISCAPELAGHKGPSAKLDLVVEMLEENLAEGHRALVFSSFTSLLDLLAKRLGKAGMDHLRLDGKVAATERTRRINRFQSGDGPSIFLISLKAGGAGINLTAADDVFLLDPWWNPAAEEQAAARAHRIGQTRPVTLYRMVAKGTIEERVLALSRSKAALASELFDAGESGGTALTADLVQELLG